MKEILDYFKDDLAMTEEIINNNIHSTIKVIPELSQYILESGGKRFRPLMVIASAALCGYRGEKAHIAACVAEYIHTATLLHDDVVDESDTRRGKTSANSIWGNEASVLVGDFLLAQAFSMMVHHLTSSSLKVMAQVCMHLAEGEILQLLNSFNINTTIDNYYQIIFGKTAALISACCEVGAILSEARDKEREALKTYGQELGYTFQIVDDCLDVTGNPKKTGKPSGNDLKEGKLTLPLLTTLKKASKEEKRTIQEAILADEITPQLIQRVKTIIMNHRGIEAAREKAREHARRAVEQLEIFEESLEKHYLTKVAFLSAEREV